jgi:hypothetical protein
MCCYARQHASTGLCYATPFVRHAWLRCGVDARVYAATADVVCSRGSSQHEELQAADGSGTAVYKMSQLSGCSDCEHHR